MKSCNLVIDLEIFPAGLGDALLIRCLGEERPVNILVDGGVRATYAQQLLRRLQALRADGQRLDLVIVTHIDSDHIAGIIELLKANGPADAPQVIDIDDVWHNGYRHLEMSGRPPNEHEKERVRSQVAMLSGSTEGEISVREGDTLASLIMAQGYGWNRSFSGSEIEAGMRTSLGQDVSITILSPRRQELQALARIWRRALLMMGVSHEAVDSPDFEAPFEIELTCADDEPSESETPISVSNNDDVPDSSTFIEDTSATNASSIAFLLAHAGCRLLFLADARPSVVLEEWRKLPGNDQPARIDLVKVSHHASRSNTSPELATWITAGRYVISTDGSKHELPHAESLLRIVGAAGAPAMLIFNYPSAAATRMNKASLRERYGHTVTIGTGTEPMVVHLSKEV